MLPPPRLRLAETLCARKDLALLATRSSGGPTSAAATFSAAGWGVAAPGAIAGSGTVALSCFAGEARLPIVSDDPARRAGAIPADARAATSTGCSAGHEATPSGLTDE